MKFRVHYTAPKLRGLHTTEIGAETKGAAAVAFNHHFRGAKLTRIEQIGRVAAPAKTPKPSVPVGPEQHPITEADRENCIKGLQKLREQLRSMPAPPARPGVAQPSIEQRDRGLRRSNP